MRRKRSLVSAILEGIAFVGLLTCFLLPIVYYQELPAEIPRHFNFKGQPDGYSHKAIIWAMPALCLALYAGISFMTRRVHLMNYPDGAAKNSPQQHSGMRHFLQVLKCLTTLFFAYTTWSMIKIALGGQEGLGALVVLLLVLAFLGTVAYYLVREKKAASS